MNDRDMMEAAIRVARVAIAHGQLPIGAVIVRDGRVVVEAHNTVWRDGDPTAHAEMVGIRQAAAALGTIDLSGCTLYSTLEPCPMCLAAIHWARIDRVVYGAVIADAQAAGFSELPINAADMARMGGSPLRVEAGPLREECEALFGEWRAAGLSKPY